MFKVFRVCLRKLVKFARPMLTDEVLPMALLLEFDLKATALPPWFPQLLLPLGHQVDAFLLVDGVSAELKWLSFGLSLDPEDAWGLRTAVLELNLIKKESFYLFLD